MRAVWYSWLRRIAGRRARARAAMLRQGWIDPCCDFCYGVDTLRALKLPGGRVAVACPPCLAETLRAYPSALDLGVIA